MSRSRTTSSFAAALLCAGAAHAVSPDLKVSSDDLNEAGEQFIELQANKARGWPLQVLAEYSYGLTDHWQAAVKFPFARQEGLHSLGVTGEIRYLGPHDRDRGGYWGIDVSAGRGRERAGAVRTSGVDVMPVLGWRTPQWHFTGNAALGLPSTGPDRRATFFGAFKAAYRLDPKSEAGVEYFIDAGPFRSWHPRHERQEYLLFAWDKVYGNELNVAVGRGLTDGSKRWLVKIVYSFPVFQK